MIIVHHLNNSRSQRVLWLLEELGLPYEIAHYQRDKKTMLAPPELRKVHPLGKSPVITDGSITVAESGAILEYLVAKAGGALKPSGEEDLRSYTYWMHYAEGSLMPLMVLTLLMNRIERTPILIRPIAKAISGQVKKAYLNPNINASLNYLNQELGTREWFAGSEFSAADVQMSFPLEAAAARGGLDARYPHLAKFLQRIHSRPAYKKALDKGGPYELLQ